MKALYIIIIVVLNSKFQSLRDRSTALLTLANTLLRCSSNVNLKSNFTCKVFLRKGLRDIIIIVKTKGGWVSLSDLRQKITSELICSDQDWNSLFTGKPNH